MVDICSERLSAKNLGSLSKKVRVLPQMKIKTDVYPLISLSDILQGSLGLAIKTDEGTGKTTATGKWKARWVQTIDGQKQMGQERARNLWWLGLCDVYQSYRDQIHVRGFYDYSDMLVEVISVLEQSPQMLADVQERFSHVLIDEFQDSNPAQIRFAHLVASHHSANGSPNIMAVGDDDQSIFKFNGAELSNMLNFRRQYPKAKTIVLKENYRSSQALLDKASQIISQAEDRLVNRDARLKKDLHAKNPPKRSGEIKSVSFSSRELQLSATARDIKKRYSPSREIAVLARNHDSLIKMSAILQNLKVPVRYEQQSNILEHEIVSQIYLIAKLADALSSGDKESANTLVHQIIRHPMWDINPEDLWQLAIGNTKNPDWMRSLAKSQSPGIKAAGNWFVWLANSAQTQPLAVTIEYMLGLRTNGKFTSPIKRYFIDGGQEKTNTYFHGLSAVQLLRALVHEFAKDSQPSLGEFVRFVELNRQNNKIIADESPFITGRHAVQLLTVHKAKGLEFDHVYIIDAIENNWQPAKGSRRPPANLPLQPAGEDFDDYVRLMYVAASRAKSSLTLSSYWLDHAGKEVALSPIVQSAFKTKRIDELNKAKLIQTLEENLRWPTLEHGSEMEMLKARLQTYSLSVTHLLNFLDLAKGGPQYFKEKNLLNLPEAKEAHMAFGTAMHDGLELAQKLVNKDAFRLRDTVATFKKSLSAQELSPSEHRRYTKKGEQTLKKLFQDYKLKLPKGSLPEQDLRDIRLKHAVIRGKMDRVDHAGTQLIINDYKTGGALPTFESKNKTLQEKIWRHKTQLVFYALLARSSARFPKTNQIVGRMIYLQAEKPARLELSYTPAVDDISRLNKLVEAVWHKIMTLDLPAATQYSPDFDGTLAFEQDLIDGKI
jgi:DNA helicase-2/ATP-dependent DNA helicase PcrA